MSRVLDLVVGARPNFVKLAPLVRALSMSPGLPYRVVHTGQHYDRTMSDVFFSELGIPSPDVHLGVGSGTHGQQIARVIERYEAHLLDRRPVATIVFGDVNSTVACALAAVKVGVPVVHVEAGLRSFDRSMPEETNRIVTDALSDLLLVSEPSGLHNLSREGLGERRIRLVGNIMIDSLLAVLPLAQRAATASRFALTERGYGLVTIHRPPNVDDAAVLVSLVGVLRELASHLPLLFLVHPRTADAAKSAGLDLGFSADSGPLRCSGPLPYVDTVSLAAGAAVILTDSGGLQEEASVLRVPCLTLRTNTERPITTTLGTSRLVGNSPDAIRYAFRDALEGRWDSGREIPLWDGRTASRIVDELKAWLAA